MSSRRIAWSTIALASTLLAAGCSTVPVTRPTAQIPARLLVKPAAAPAIDRNPDGSISGSQALTGINGLYEYIGGLKGQLDSLIDAVTARDSPPPKKHHHLF